MEVGVQVSEHALLGDTIHELETQVQEWKGRFLEFQKHITDEIEHQIHQCTQSQAQIFAEHTTNLARAYEKRLEAIQKSHSVQIKNELAVSTATIEREAKDKMEALMAAHTEEVANLRKQVLVYRTEGAHNAEAAQVLKEQLTAARNLLTKNGIAFDAQPISVMQLVDPFPLQAALAAEQKISSELRSKLDSKSYEAVMLATQLKGMRVEQAQTAAARDERIAALTEEIRLLKLDAEGDVRARITEEVRAAFMREYSSDLKKTEERVRRSSIAMAEKSEQELQARVRAISQQLAAADRAHEAALQKRDEDHREEIERLNRLWEKKMAVVQEGLGRLSRADSAAQIMDQQSRVFQLASIIHSRSPSKTSFSLPSLTP